MVIVGTGTQYFLCFWDDIFRGIRIDDFRLHWNKHEQTKVINLGKVFFLLSLLFHTSPLTDTFLPLGCIWCQAMKEILLAGDTNRLVAELTFVSWLEV